MAKRRAKVVADRPIEETPPAEAPAERGVTYTVRFTGQTRAVLNGRLILHNETRSGVPQQAIDKAERYHPGEFEILHADTAKEPAHVDLALQPDQPPTD